MKTIILTAALLLASAGAAQAEPPFVLPHGSQDVKTAIAGVYTLDPNHIGVIVRVPHLGFSLSVFRFDKAEGTLHWDPAHIDKSTLSASVETGSIATNVADFAAELAGDKYLKSAAYPKATFVSTAFRQSDATHGKVDGNFTLMGKTVPLTFAVTLIGAGPGFAGGPTMGHVLGIHAEAEIDPQDFGLPALLKGPIQIAIDTEFDRKP